MVARSISSHNNWDPQLKTMNNTLHQFRVLPHQVVFGEFFRPCDGFVGCDSLSFSLCEDIVGHRDPPSRTPSNDVFQDGR